MKYYHIESPNQVTRNIIFVDSKGVDEKYRRRRMEHEIFSFLKALGIQKGYDGIELQVNAKNEDAYKIYYMSSKSKE